VIRPPYDGWIDHGASREILDGERVAEVSEDQALQLIAQFRGEILAAAYLLEASLDRLILWHLFRDRQDGMAAFFEDLILREIGFGLERKVRVAHAIIDYWNGDDSQAANDKRLLDRARHIRNQVAHWPSRLVPVLQGGDAVGFDLEMVKGNEVTALNELARQQILDDFGQARARLEELSVELADFAHREEN
jgi:hypothetical protein